MKLAMNKILATSVFFILGITLWAQPSTKDFIKKGEEAFVSKNYSGAMHFLSEAFNRDDSNTAVLYKLIQAEKKQYAYKSAEKHLHFLLDDLKSTKYPKAYKDLADLKLQTGQYKDAKKYYELFLSENDDALTRSKVDMSLKSAEWSLENDEEVEGVEIETLGFNTGYSEHAPIEIDGELSYSSLKYKFDNDKHKPKRYLSKIIDGQSNDIDKQVNLNSDNMLSSNLAQSADGNYLAFTRCKYVNSSDIICDLYISSKDSNGEWKEAKRAGDVLNVPGTTTTQPTFGKSENGKQELYFVSNRKNGRGGMDIYKSSFDAQMNFGVVQNVSDINTRASEVTPFYDVNNNVLYFSSNGRVGYGSFDVYKYESGEIENMGKPINTSYQDIYYTSYENGERNYISSNRPGSKYLDAKFETCCFDIYQVNKKKETIDLLALTFDASNNSELFGANVELLEILSENGMLKANELGNDFLYENINVNKEYKLRATKEGFEDAMVTVTGKELKEALASGQLIKKLYLAPNTTDLLVRIFEEPSKKELYGTTVSLIDITAGDIEVDRVTLGESNTFSFKVIPGHCYKIRVNKTGYEQALEQYCVPTDGSKAKKDVFLGRAAEIETLAKLIPLKLYYDNDTPDPSTVKPTTERKYSDTYDKYYARKGYFTKVYSNQGGAADRVSRAAEVESFFESDLRVGREKLDMFLETLTRILQKGKSVNLFLRGYASPLSVNEYNTALGKRRVDAVRNEIERYNGGVLKGYLNSGMLIVTERSFGEETSDGKVSDDPNAPRNSIFSPDASRERRVEIDEIKEVIIN